MNRQSGDMRDLDDLQCALLNGRLKVMSKQNLRGRAYHIESPKASMMISSTIIGEVPMGGTIGFAL